MLSALLTDQAFAIIISATVTALAGVAVAVISRKKSSKKSAPDGWQAWVDDLRKQVRGMKKEFESKTERMQEEITQLETQLQKSEDLSNRRLKRLMSFSRRYNVDISDVLQ